MGERIEVYLLYEDNLSIGELDEFGSLTVGIRDYAAWGKIPTKIEDANGQRINIEHILVAYENFKVIKKELEANGIETKPS